MKPDPSIPSSVLGSARNGLEIVSHRLDAERAVERDGVEQDR